MLESSFGIYFHHLILFQPFDNVPKLKLTYRINNGYNSVNDVMMAWVKGVDESGAELCIKELYPFSGYHYDFEFVSSYYCDQKKILIFNLWVNM